MELPVIAIVGRPNVGKSAFFNAVVGSRISIVDPVAGVTRDRVSQIVEYSGRCFELIDTGGIGLFDDTLLREEIERQIEIAIASADGVIFIVDVRDGIVPLDQEVARRLRQISAPVLLVANKADHLTMEYNRHQFHGLGFGEPLAVSALEGRSVFEAVDLILEQLPPSSVDGIDVLSIPKVAIVGKMNAGKSTLVNYLAQEERVIVSELPGTTRDSVDVQVEIGGSSFVVIDTAGIRRKRAIQDSVDFYGQARSARAIRRADVVLFLLDATCEISNVDSHIGADILTAMKPTILCITKWDLAEGYTPEAYIEYTASKLPGMNFAPLSFMSSKTGFNVEETFRLVLELWKQASFRASTSEVNKVLQDAFTQRSPRTKKSKVAKIYFGVQVDVGPPTLVVFVNDTGLFNDEYRRYLAGRFREGLNFREVPLRINFRGKGQKMQ